MKQNITWITVGLFFALVGASAQAQVVMAPVAPPVEHPLVANHPVRTAGGWRKGLGQFGESFAESSLKSRGYNVLDMKLPGNHGVDRVAVKRNPIGKLLDVRLVEVKAHYGKSKPRLGMTKSGPQMSRKWLADWLRKLRATGEEGKNLAKEISSFRKAKSIGLESLGEVHDINLRNGKYTIRNPISMAERAGPMPIQRMLNKLASRSHQPVSQAWAARHVAQFDQLRQARMGHWLSASPSTRALDRVSSTKSALLEEKQALRGARKGLARSAGRAAIYVVVAMDAYEIYGHVRDYRLGKLSRQELIIAAARSSGGAAGAWAGWGVGSSAGALLGAKLGLLGGPFAETTVPLGAGIGWFVGGTIGGYAGYRGGSYAGDAIAQAWYRSLDGEVRVQISRWIKETPNLAVN